MVAKSLLGFSLLLALGGSAPAAWQPGAAVPQRMRAQPGEKVRIVRFTVSPDMRSEFERFFRESLKPAAERRAGAGADIAGSFRLLIPESINRDKFYTYYVVIDPIRGDLTSGETMRDMVRAAFPGEEGERRVQQWMSSIVLGDMAPVGEDFIEADLVKR